jgi:hypothetical protein
MVNKYHWMFVPPSVHVLLKHDHQGVVTYEIMPMICVIVEESFKSVSFCVYGFWFVKIIINQSMKKWIVLYVCFRFAVCFEYEIIGKNSKQPQKKSNDTNRIVRDRNGTGEIIISKRVLVERPTRDQ